MPGKVPGPGLEGASEAREAYRAKVHKAWEGQRKRLYDLLASHARREPHSVAGRTLAKCRSVAQSLQDNAPGACRDWSEEIVRLTDRASQVLAHCEGDTLEAILSRLLDGIVDHVTMRARPDKGHKAELVAVSPLSSNAFLQCRHAETSCRATGQSLPLYTAWYVTRTTSRVDKAHPSGKQLGEDPTLVNEVNPEWLNAASYRCPRILPPAVNLPEIPRFLFEGEGEQSLARLGLRAQRRYQISARRWECRWAM